MTNNLSDEERKMFFEGSWSFLPQDIIESLNEKDSTIADLEFDLETLQTAKKQSDRGIDLQAKEITRRELELKLKDHEIKRLNEKIGLYKAIIIIIIVLWIWLSI